jgi:hypothetical protein
MERVGVWVRLVVADDSAVRDEGTIIVLEGITEEGQVYWFACDRRCALQIIHDVQAGLDVSLEVEPWQILGGAR